MTDHKAGQARRPGDLGRFRPGRRRRLNPVAALMLCGPFTVRDLLVEGRPVVRDSMLTTVDPAAVAEAARRRVARLAP